MSSNELLPLYHRILSAAEAIKESTSAVLDANDIRDYSLHEGASQPSLSVLVLPPTPSILQSLIDGGVENAIAQRLSSAFDRALTKLREEIKTSFRNAWSQVILTPRHTSMLPLKDLHSRLSATHAHIFQRKADTWASEVRQRAFVRRASTQDSCETKSENTELSRVARPSFNNVGETDIRICPILKLTCSSL